MARLPPEPITGLDAATSGVAHPQPNIPPAPVDGSLWAQPFWPPKGLAKLGWLRMLKNSARNCALNRSVKFPGLPHREVPVAKSGIAEFVASHGAKSPQRGWQQYRIALGEAAESTQRCAIQTRGIAAIEGKGLRGACRIRLTRRVRDWSRARSEIRRAARRSSSDHSVRRCR